MGSRPKNPAIHRNIAVKWLQVTSPGKEWDTRPPSLNGTFQTGYKPRKRVGYRPSSLNGTFQTRKELSMIRSSDTRRIQRDTRDGSLDKLTQLAGIR
jgi:hypothetical protein